MTALLDGAFSHLHSLEGFADTFSECFMCFLWRVTTVPTPVGPQVMWLVPPSNLLTASFTGARIRSPASFQARSLPSFTCMSCGLRCTSDDDREVRLGALRLCERMPCTHREVALILLRRFSRCFEAGASKRTLPYVSMP